MKIEAKPSVALNNSSDSTKITRIHDLLTANKGLFADRELMFLLKRTEASRILGVPIKRNDVGDSILGDLITREEIREWSNLPEIYKPKEGKKEGISLLSVFEYMVKRNGGIVESPGKFSLDKDQVALQKNVLRRILAQVPEFN